MKFQIKVGAKELFRFNMRHTYRSFSGLLGLAISLTALVVAAMTATKNPGYQIAVLLFVGAYYTVLHPWMLWSRAKAAAKNSMFQDPMEYEFTETGFAVRQGEAEADYTWEQIARVISAKQELIIYMDKIHAHVLPKEQLNGQAEQVLAHLREHLPKGKVK